MSKATIICIIDDDDIYQFTVTRALKAQNIAKKIMVFSDGEEALDFFTANIGDRDNIPDVIFLDMHRLKSVSTKFEMSTTMLKNRP